MVQVRHDAFIFVILRFFVFQCKNKRADDKKRYTAAILRHHAVLQNTLRFFTPIRYADWSTQPRTGC